MLLGPIVGANPEEWELMIAINQTNTALPHFLSAAEKEPRHVADIVNVSLIAGRLA
jgi:hypothetical protein